MNYQPALVQLPLVCETRIDRIVSPADAYRVCADIAALAQESFHVLTLNTKHAIINRHMVSLGLLDSTPVHPREVFRAAIVDGAAAVVLVHGHPSGDPTPSAEDLRVTRQITEAGRVIGIRVLDHVVVGRPFVATADQPGRPGFVSMRESGLCTFA